MEVQVKTEVEPINFESSSFGSDIPVQGRLLVRDGIIGNKSVKVLIDSVASTNLIKPGLIFKILSTQKVQARRFDGTWHHSAHKMS